jgi:HrpA-like RNA helicase
LFNLRYRYIFVAVEVCVFADLCVGSGIVTRARAIGESLARSCLNLAVLFLASHHTQFLLLLLAPCLHLVTQRYSVDVAGIKDVASFDFMDPPASDSLNTALRQLSLISAVQIGAGGVRLTPLGQKMAGFPLDPRY